MFISQVTLETQERLQEEYKTLVVSFKSAKNGILKQMVNTVELLNRQHKNLIGKCVKIHIKRNNNPLNEHKYFVHNELFPIEETVICYFDGFFADYSMDSPRINLCLYKVKNNGEKSKNRQYIHAFLDEIESIELV